ncbi:hypothetical protein B0A48_07105 [Cryoendolithus antarcticus]|uniref:Protein BIG1 n=1 Tax=Cryoendolithus antarcticus TaxID=1507870 RepID=A0A1V8T855_9PEZI|nr:hypothetical protein B0A48_07105 [Cryoendolithus antarcticus]
MLLRCIGALLTATSAVNAFHNSSPFLLLSSNPIESAPRSLEIATEQTITDLIASASSPCDATSYIILSQPGLTTADLRDSAHHKGLKALSATGFSVEVTNVIGELDIKGLTKTVAKNCDAGDASEEKSRRGETVSYVSTEKKVVLASFEALPVGKQERAAGLKSFDAGLSSWLHRLDKNYVFILASTPVEAAEAHAHMYEMDEPYPTAMHQDLKRGLELERRAKGNSSSGDHMQDGLPLFEKYKFLSPGIFMSLSVSLLLVIILWVGVSAIAGLEVSYAAFSKEMGPAAQNKGKQQ